VTGGVTIGTVETSGGFVPLQVAGSAFSGWDRVAGAWSLVRMGARYAPNPGGTLPHRGPVNAGDTIALPSFEAAALIAAGFASSASGTATQVGSGTN
jgi:hypothetical protein